MTVLSMASVSSIAELRTVNHLVNQTVYVEGYYTPGDGGGGNYFYVAGSTSADNGGTVIVAKDGARWKLSIQDTISVRQFGAKGDGTTNDATAIQSAINWALNAQVSALYAPAGIYRVTTSITASISGIRSFALFGDGPDVTEFFFDGAANGFSFTTQSGNWWFDVSPSTSLDFYKFSVTTTNLNTGTGFYINGGSLEGRPAKKTTFTDVTFRSKNSFTQGWAKFTHIYNTGNVWFTDCRWIQGGPGNFGNIGCYIEGTEAGGPTAFNFTSCESVYGNIWVQCGNYCEGLYLVSCSQVGGNYGVYYSTTSAESGLHLVNGHYNNNIANVYIKNLYHYEIVGALFFHTGTNNTFKHITADGCGAGVISGNVFEKSASTLEYIGIYITNTLDSNRSTLIGDNSFSKFTLGNSYPIYIQNTAKSISVGQNSYAIGTINTVVDAGGNYTTNSNGNWITKKNIVFSTVMSITGGATTVNFSIPLAANVFSSAPLIAIVAPAQSLGMWFTYDVGSSTATSLSVQAGRYDASDVVSGTYRLSVYCAQD